MTPDKQCAAQSDAQCPVQRCAWLGVQEAPPMTYQCAWCLQITAVNLIATLRFGLSHGVCWDCMPRWIGRGQ